MKTAVLITITLCLVGCNAVGPDYDGPPEVAPSSGFFGKREKSPGAIVDKWWRQLNSPQLNRLVDRALANNHDVQVAAQRLREARALRRQAASAFLPRANSNLAFTRLDYGGLVNDSPVSSVLSAGFLGNPLDYWGTGLDLSWEIDVFGGRQREVRGARARSEAAAEALHGARLAITAEVTESYFTIAGLREQLDRINAQVIHQESQFNDVRARLNAGAASALDVDRAQSRLESIRAERPMLEAGVTSQLRRLALLLGTQPQALDNQKIAIKPLPARLPMARTGLPAQLVLRRPDLRQAERELAAATEDIGVAVSNFYPKFVIGGGPSAISSSFVNLFNASSVYWQYAPRIEWSPFTGGANRAILETASARQKITLLNYEKRVLAAIGEVESEIANLQGQTERLAIVQRAHAATKAAVKRVEESYNAGAISYLDVLVEEQTLRDVEITEVRVKNQLIQVWVRLHKALGGGWSK